MRQVLRLNNFSGGLSDDDKMGPPNSFAEGQGVDFRKSPGIISLQKGLFPESTNGASDGVILTEVYDACRDKSGNVYFAGGTNFYKRAVSSNAGYGLYTLASNAPFTMTDVLYLENLDMILGCDGSVISEYYPVSSSPTFTYGKYGPYNMIDTAKSGGTYTLPTSISEAAADKYEFVATADPLNGNTVNINTKSTGSLILTIHDDANNVVLQCTRTNGSLPASGDMQSLFWDTPNSQGRLQIGKTYHAHLTSTAGGQKVTTGPLNTMADVDLVLQANRMVDTGTTYGHRMIQMGAKIFICNERYLSQWEILSTATNTTDGYTAAKLAFPGNFVTIGLAEYNEYLAIACAVKNGSDSLDALGSEGMIFLWDTTSSSYNVAIAVPQGVPNSLFNYRNALYWECKGRWYRWSGGDIETVFEFPDIDRWQAADNAPQSEVYLRASTRAMTSWNGLLMIGFPYQTANLNTKYGIYSYGKQKSSAPDAVGYDYVPSQLPDAQVQFTAAGSPLTPITAITMVKSFGSNLFVAYKTRPNPAGSTLYFIDYTNDAQGYRTAGSWAGLWFDAGTPDKEKTFLSLVITMKPLPANSTIQAKVRFNRNTTWFTDTSGFDGEGATIVRLTMPIQQSRFREAQFGFDLTNDATTGDTPEIISVCLEYDDNQEEDSTGESV